MTLPHMTRPDMTRIDAARTRMAIADSNVCGRTRGKAETHAVH
jgi:hypothetical protein